MTRLRNVLKATIDVPGTGEVDVYCTQLDYLDENWRMKQVNAIIQSSENPHILVGGLNTLDRSDYSLERWIDILKVHFILLNFLSSSSMIRVSYFTLFSSTSKR